MEYLSRKNVFFCCFKYFAAQSVNKDLFPIFFFFFSKNSKINKRRGGGDAFIWDVRVHGMWKSRLKLGCRVHYYFIIFIFDMYCSFFIGSGSFAIVERGVYDSTPIVLKKLYHGRSSYIKKIFAEEAVILAKVAHEKIVPML